MNILLPLRGSIGSALLSLRETEITDAGLKHLKPLADLDVLYFEGTQVTEEGVAQLPDALPHCTIFSTFHPENAVKRRLLPG